MKTLAFLPGLLVLAALASTNAAYADCSDASTQAGMNQCYGNEFSAADKKLNDSYKVIVKRLSDDPDTKRLLVASQRAWVAYRDAECKFSSSAAADGSIYPTIVSTCMTNLTDDRVKDFERYLSCEEGDLSCPVPPAD